MEEAKEMYGEVLKEQDTRITRPDASPHQSYRDTWQSSMYLTPKTKREARQAAAALFGENGVRSSSKNFLTRRNQPCSYERGIETDKTLIERGVSLGRGKVRQSLQGTMHEKASQRGNKFHAFPRKGNRNVGMPSASTNCNQALRRHLLNELRQLQNRERDFLYLEIIDAMKSDHCSVLSFLISGKREFTKKPDKPLTILSFYKNKSRLKYESPVVRQFYDMGWPVARECIESVGHAVERLHERLKQHGWKQRVW